MLIPLVSLDRLTPARCQENTIQQDVQKGQISHPPNPGRLLYAPPRVCKTDSLP